DQSFRVGLGTFGPVSVEDIDAHKVHSEFHRVDQENATKIRRAQEGGHKVIAVGTTSIRTLETIGTKFKGQVQADSGWTDIFIAPGYQFSVVEGFITYFHLSKSYLIMFVSDFPIID